MNCHTGGVHSRACQDCKKFVTTRAMCLCVYVAQVPVCQPQLFHCSSATTTGVSAAGRDGQRLAPKPAGLLPGLGAGFAFLTLTSDALQGSLGLTLLSALMSAATCAATASNSDTTPKQQ